MLYKDWRGIFYYTILSNFYVVLFYGITLCLEFKNKLNKSNGYYMSKGFMLLAILSTMFIFFLVVNNQDSVYSGHPVQSYLAHLVIPVLTLLECALYEDKNVLRYRYVIYWDLMNVFYTLVLVIYRGVFKGVFLEGKHYPYDVMNFEKLGAVKGITNCLYILVFFTVIGSIIVFFDNKMKKTILGGNE